jgi:hypothetical protein
MLLPPGTLAALKGHFHGIVATVVFTVACAAMAAGAPPWPTIVGLAIALLMYHIRSSRREEHEERIAQQGIDQAVAHVEAIKARHRDLLQVEQPVLPLGSAPRTPTRGRGDT